MQQPFRYTVSFLALATLWVWSCVQGQHTSAPFPGWSVAVAQDAAKPVTVAEQFQALQKEFQLAANAYFQSATTADEKKQIIERADRLTLKCLELAENNLKDPLALDILTAVVTQEYWLNNHSSHLGWGQESPQAKAIALMQRDHLTSDKLAEPCRRIQYGFRPECATFLRMVSEKNPHREVQAVASLYLARFLASRLDKVELFKDQPELLDRYETLYGKEYIESLRRQDRAQAIRDVETLFQQTAEQYGEVKLPYAGTVGEQAKIELFDLQHLAVGNPAPEIEGVDQDGQPFKLSEYRGKVVLLYFWSEY